MTFDLALRITEILMALALIQHSLEHLRGPKSEQFLFGIRLTLSLGMLLGMHTAWLCLGLVILTLFILRRFQGPYNGGADRMSILILCCVTAAHWMPTPYLKELSLGYLAIQLVLSYFISGWVKVVNPEWRNGKALNDVFRFSAYPACESLRSLAQKYALLFTASWAVILFELAFPVTLLNQTALIIGLTIAALFHLANAYLFGLNRFFWIWLAAYPSILWLQGRILELS